MLLDNLIMPNSVKKLLNSDKNKLFCVEVNPPKGSSPTNVFSKLDKFLGQVDFFNVTDSALSRMRMNPIAFAAVLKQRYGAEPLVNLSCRDRNLIAMQGDILAGYMQGIESVVALTGDAMSIGDNKERKAVFEVNSIGLLDTIRTLNAGEDLAGNKLEGIPDICPGAVVNPNAKNMAAEIRKLEKKKAAGAMYALSQPVFDAEVARNFFQAAAEVGIPLFLGLLPFKNSKAVRSFSKIPGIKISDKLVNYIGENPQADLREYAFNLCYEIAAGSSEYVRGFHVICGVTPVLAIKFLKFLQNKLSK